MVDWSVKGVGIDVTVVSSEGDVYPFQITSPKDLHIELTGSPLWHDGKLPIDADRKIDAAYSEASRWTSDTFGPVIHHAPGTLGCIQGRSTEC